MTRHGGHAKSMPPALDGIRVLDAGQLLAGPFAATLLGDYGADVIKVERPGVGDPIRAAVGRGWLTEGRNKRLITLNLQSDAGREVFLDLVKVADVVIENFRAEKFAKLGLSDDVMLDANPGLVIAHASGYGQIGPRAQEGAFDRAAIAYSGVGAITGFADSPPVKVGVDMADYLTGWHIALQIMIALHYRDRTGRGQVIDTALFEAPFRMTREMITDYSLTGAIPPRMGNQHQAVAPGDAYPTLDAQWIAISCGNDAAWRAIARAIGRPELQTDDDYATNAARMRHRQHVDALVADYVASENLSDVATVMEREGVAFAKYNSMADIARDEQFRVIGAIMERNHEEHGVILLPGVVGRLSETPGSVRWLGRSLGADNDEVYESLLGLDQQRLRALREADII